jgi:hypothetical protein
MGLHGTLCDRQPGRSRDSFGAGRDGRLEDGLLVAAAGPRSSTSITA